MIRRLNSFKLLFKWIALAGRYAAWAYHLHTQIAEAAKLFGIYPMWNNNDMIAMCTGECVVMFFATAICIRADKRSTRFHLSNRRTCPQ